MEVGQGPNWDYSAKEKKRGRSQWARGLRLDPKLGSWARIPLKAWISVCAYCVFV
jgi:hypothetical protein